MCKPFSGVAVRRHNRYLDWSDGHEDIIEFYGLPDDPKKIVRYEYAPREGRYDDLASYELRVDQDIVPDWWETRTGQIEAEMHARVKRCIVADKRKLLGGGPWILSDGADIDRVVNARIIAMYDSARIEHMCGSASIGHMSDSASIGHMCGSARIEHMSDSASIGHMYDSASIGHDYRVAQ